MIGKILVTTLGGFLTGSPPWFFLHQAGPEASSIHHPSAGNTLTRLKNSEQEAEIPIAQ
jgi:hypothetical protein